MRVRKDVLAGAIMLALALGIVAMAHFMGPGGAGRGASPLTVRPWPGKPGWFEAAAEAMGTDVRLEAPASSLAAARRMFEAALEPVEAVEGLMSIYRPDSEISRLNRSGAQQSVKLSEDTMAVIRKAVEGSRLTDGAFDVAYAPLRTLWHQAERDGRVPSPEDIKKTLEAVGSQRLVIEDSSVRFGAPGMEVDLGGVAAGYAVDRAAQVLQQAGAKSGIVDIGGDLRLFGEPAPGEKWRILVQPPPGASERIVLSLDPCGVATSGDYARFFRIGGKRFSQIIDPRTGWPVAGMSSVTIVARDALTADVLSTGISVLGTEKGLALVERLPDVHCMIMEQQPDGTLRKTMSHGFPELVESAAPAGAGKGREGR